MNWENYTFILVLGIMGGLLFYFYYRDKRKLEIFKKDLTTQGFKTTKCLPVKAIGMFTNSFSLVGLWIDNDAKHFVIRNTWTDTTATIYDFSVLRDYHINQNYYLGKKGKQFCNTLSLSIVLFSEMGALRIEMTVLSSVTEILIGRNFKKSQAQLQAVTDELQYIIDSNKASDFNILSFENCTINQSQIGNHNLMNKQQ